LRCIPSFPQTAQDASFKFTTINYAQNAKDSSTVTKPNSEQAQTSGNDIKTKMFYGASFTSSFRLPKQDVC
jgi:hypothetical protein